MYKILSVIIMDYILTFLSIDMRVPNFYFILISNVCLYIKVS